MGTDPVVPLLSIDPQFAWNGLVIGSVFAIAALGLTIIFGVLDFILVCYGEYMAVGAYIAWVSFADFGTSIYVAIVVGMVSVALLSYTLDKTVFQHFRADDRSRVTLLIVSIGISFILRNAIRIAWGTYPRFFRRTGAKIQESTEIAGVFVRQSDFAIMGISLVALTVAFLILQRTNVGIAMRAASDDLDLVRVRGVDTDRLVVYVWIIGGAIAGLAGVMAGVHGSVSPRMGVSAIILIFGAVIIGGIGRPVGAVAGGYIMGFTRELSVVFGVPTTYKVAVPFLVFVAVLMLRPEGLIGQSTRDT